MSTSRTRRAAAALVASGVCLLGSGCAGEPERPPARRLTPSVPQAPDHARHPGAWSGAQELGGPGRVALGQRLRTPWPELRPTRLVLRPGTGAAAAPVDRIGVVRGVLALPEDADRVGWWRGGSRVGSPFGTVVVAGHLDSPTDPEGYLAGLSGLAPGDLVELSDHGVRQRYRVVRNYLLPAADLSSRSDLFAQQRRHRLLLITCGGPYDQVRGRYRDNRVVEAVPVAG